MCNNSYRNWHVFHVHDNWKWGLWYVPFPPTQLQNGKRVWNVRFWQKSENCTFSTRANNIQMENRHTSWSLWHRARRIDCGLVPTSSKVNDRQSGGCLRVALPIKPESNTGGNREELRGTSVALPGPDWKLLSLGRNGEARNRIVSRWSRLQTQSSKHECWCIRNGLIRSSQNIHQKNHKIEKFHRCAVCVILKFGPLIAKNGDVKVT